MDYGFRNVVTDERVIEKEKTKMSVNRFPKSRWNPIFEASYCKLAHIIEIHEKIHPKCKQRGVIQRRKIRPGNDGVAESLSGSTSLNY